MMEETVSASTARSQTRRPRTLIVVGASAGGVSTLERFIAAMPADVPAAICVVIHFPASATSVLPQILTRAGRIAAVHAVDGETLIERRIYVAPPDFHMTVRDTRIRLTRGPRIHRNRPAIDPLFNSAGVWYRDRAVGVVLSGNLDDGTLGMLALKRYGGLAIAQDPEDAMHPDMPRSVIENVTVDHILPADRMAEVIDGAARATAQRLDVAIAGGSAAPSARAEDDADEASLTDRLHETDATGAYSCPDCGGVLEPVGDIGLVRYQCRVGHAYSAESLFAAQEDEVEQALWMALRALEEKVELAVRLERRFRSLGQERAAERYADRARLTAERAGSLRTLLRRETLLDAGD
jgi:two-component system chemotaxis response regulator CheB